MVVGIGTEEVSEDLCVLGCVASPHVPDLVAQRICDELECVIFAGVIGRVVWWCSVGIIGSIEVLRWEET